MHFSVDKAKKPKQKKAQKIWNIITIPLRINQQKSSNMDTPFSYALLYAIARERKKKQEYWSEYLLPLKMTFEHNRTFSFLISSRNNNYMSQNNHYYILQATPG